MIRRAIAIDKQVMSVDATRVSLGSNLAQHRVAEAEALNKIGDAAGALQSYKESRSLYQSLADLDARNLDARLNVSATDAKIAATYLRLRQVDDARETYLRALQVQLANTGLPRSRNEALAMATKTNRTLSQPTHAFEHEVIRDSFFPSRLPREPPDTSY